MQPLHAKDVRYALFLRAYCYAILHIVMQYSGISVANAFYRQRISNPFSAIMIEHFILIVIQNSHSIIFLLSASSCCGILVLLFVSVIVNRLLGFVVSLARCVCVVPFGLMGVVCVYLGCVGRGGCLLFPPPGGG